MGPCLCGDPACQRCFPGNLEASPPSCHECKHDYEYHIDVQVWSDDDLPLEPCGYCQCTLSQENIAEHYEREYDG